MIVHDIIYILYDYFVAKIYKVEKCVDQIQKTTLICKHGLKVPMGVTDSYLL